MQSDPLPAVRNLCKNHNEIDNVKKSPGRRILRAVLLVDESLFVPDDPDFMKRPKKPWEAEFSVSHALRMLGHSVVGIPATLDVAETIVRIKAAGPDFVFNLVDEMNGRREDDSLLVRIVERMEIRCTGASAESLMLS